MPTTSQYTIKQSDECLVVEVSRSITFEGVVEAYAEVARLDREHRQPRLWLLPEDASKRMLEEFSLDQLRRLVETASSFEVAGKAAIVTASDVLFAKMRQLTMMRPDDPDRFAVFRSEPEAVAWLITDQVAIAAAWDARPVSDPPRPARRRPRRA